MPPRRLNSPWLILPLAVACALAPGCAGLHCPRIDPTGERFFIWPKDQVRTPVATVPALAANPTAPPVTTDPIFPQPSVVAPPATAAPGVAIAPAVTPVSAAFPQVPTDKLIITPERILAPVNSEVVLKTSICTTKGYTLADEKIEWMLGRNGVGQFVEVGGKGLFHPPLLPWAKGSKVDNYLAHGYTATDSMCISRGTPDPTDDVNINRGDAWISVTSPNEGVSHVTSYAPLVKSWDQRRASATIYWVDVQWTFPPASVSSSGRAETLTTQVTRQTDGTPLEGWIVRYVVADGGAPSEVRTNAEGRASVQVTPTASGAPSSRIDAQLIRPAGFGGVEAPQLVIASGSTLVNWGGGTAYVPPITGQPLPTSPPMGTNPAQPLPQTPITPQPQLPATTPAAPARLEVEIQAPAQTQVGGTARFIIAIRNVGDAPATNVKLTDRLDLGLIFPPDPSKNVIENPRIGTIGPRSMQSIPVDLQVSKSGSLCQNVAVEYAEGPPATAQKCIIPIEAPPQRDARLEVRVETEKRQYVVGETAVFKVVTKNTGETPLMNIQTEEEYPLAIFTPQPTDNVPVISGKISRRIDRLEPGQVVTHETRCLCRQATSSVPVIVRAIYDTGAPGTRTPTAADVTVEILQARTQPPFTATNPAPPGAASTEPLGLSLTFVNPSVLVNSRVNATVTVKNKSAAAQQNVALRLLFEPNVTIDVANLEGPPGVTAKVVNNQLVFTPLPNLAAGDVAIFRIPMNTIQVGRVPFSAAGNKQ